ncbi:hypothetical protein C8R43DRAFT_1053352 [Mycena crocata]|nr:hypothetical protein C8R43DRAFT_1053352 [Mycena crocata]
MVSRITFFALALAAFASVVRASPTPTGVDACLRVSVRCFDTCYNCNGAIDPNCAGGDACYETCLSAGGCEIKIDPFRRSL